jgi:hypothetical protein
MITRTRLESLREKNRFTGHRSKRMEIIEVAISDGESIKLLVVETECKRSPIA